MGEGGRQDGAETSISASEAAGANGIGGGGGGGGGQGHAIHGGAGGFAQIGESGGLAFSSRLRKSLRRNASTTNIGARRLTISTLALATEKHFQQLEQTSSAQLESTKEEDEGVQERDPIKAEKQDKKDEGAESTDNATASATTSGALSGADVSVAGVVGHGRTSPVQEMQPAQQQQTGNRLRSSQMFNMSRNIGDATIRELDEAETHDGSEDVSNLTDLCAVIRGLPKPPDRTSDHRKELLRTADKLNFFSRFFATTKLDVCRDMEYEHFQLGEDVYGKGEESHKMYIVLSGHLDMLNEKRRPEMGVGPGSTLGLSEMAKSEPRELTAHCITDVEAISINRTCYVTAVRRSATMIALSKVDMLRKLSSYEKEGILEAMEFECIDAGTAVFRQGDEGNKFYLIVSGKARVSKMEITGNVVDLLALDKNGDKKHDTKKSRETNETTSATHDNNAGTAGGAESGNAAGTAAAAGTGTGATDTKTDTEKAPDTAISPEQKEKSKELDFQIKYGEEREIRVLGPGDFFGELALITSEPRAATVSALTRLEIISLGRNAYLRLAETASSDIAMQGNRNTSGKLERSKLRQILASNEERTQADCELMARMLGDIPFFNNLPFHTRIDLSMRMSHETFAPNRVIFLQGDVGDKFYIVITGEVRIDVAVGKDGGQMKEVARVGPGAHFGEVALLRNVPRSATVTATQECEFLVLDRETYSQVMKTEELSRIATNVKFMSGCLLFSKWSHNLIVKVAYYCSMEEHEKGTELVRQGDIADKAFIIRSGSCRVVYKSWIDDSVADIRVRKSRRNKYVPPPPQQQSQSQPRSRPVTVDDKAPGSKSKSHADGGDAGVGDLSDDKLEDMMASGSYLSSATSDMNDGAAPSANQTEVLRKTVQVALLGVGDFFGIPSILSGRAHRVSVIADSYCKLMAIPRSVMETRVGDLDSQVRRIALSRDETYVHRGRRALDAFRKRMYGDQPASIVKEWKKAGSTGPFLNVIDRKGHSIDGDALQAALASSRARSSTMTTTSSTTTANGAAASMMTTTTTMTSTTTMTTMTGGGGSRRETPKYPSRAVTTTSDSDVKLPSLSTTTATTAGLRTMSTGIGKREHVSTHTTSTNPSTIVKSYSSITGNLLHRQLTGFGMNCPTRSEQVMFAVRKRHAKAVQMANEHKGGVIEDPDGDDDDDDDDDMMNKTSANNTGGMRGKSRAGYPSGGDGDAWDHSGTSSSTIMRARRSQMGTPTAGSAGAGTPKEHKSGTPFSRGSKQHGSSGFRMRRRLRKNGTERKSSGTTTRTLTKAGAVQYEVPSFSTQGGFVQGCMEGACLYLG